VQAQLILHGKGHGPHLFFVPLRSMEDHSVLPGVVCGDIGPKVYGAYSFIDNGWIRFDHVRIPRDNMLMKNAKVTKEGQYIKPPVSKHARERRCTANANR
jgi:acyl-CoA oxidase